MALNSYLDDQDSAIRSTDFDALSCRLSTHLKGYIFDPYIELLIPNLINYKTLSVESQFKSLAVRRNLKKQFFGLFDITGKLDSTNATTAQRSITNTYQQGTLQRGQHPTLSRPQVLKSPVINRGTWLRTYSIDLIVKQFIDQSEIDEPIQIISLGSGNDTRAFNLLPQYPNLTYIELDFEETCKIKRCAILNPSTKLYEPLSIDHTSEDTLPQNHEQFRQIPAELHSSRYHLIPVDLRDLSFKEQITPYMDFTRKTLVLSECCICYLSTDKSNELLAFFKQILEKGVFLIYEPIGGSDDSMQNESVYAGNGNGSFDHPGGSSNISNQSRASSSYGEIMLRNLSTRSIDMPSLLSYGTIASQKQRLIEIGLDANHIGVSDLKFVYFNWVQQEILEKVTKLEFLDEIEELNLINLHYCLIVASWGFKLQSKFTPYQI